MGNHVSWLVEGFTLLLFINQEHMTDKEYMDMIIKQWKAIDDDPDLFDELNSFEEETFDD